MHDERGAALKTALRRPSQEPQPEIKISGAFWTAISGTVHMHMLRLVSATRRKTPCLRNCFLITIWRN
jgi:hypothetical protein